MRRIGRSTVDRAQPVHILVQHWNCAKQPQRIGVRRILEQLADSTVFYNLSRVDDSYLVAGLRNNRKIMRNHDQRHISFLLQICEHILDLRL